LKTGILVKKTLIAIALLFSGVIQVSAQGPSTFEFTENRGQWESQIKFKGELPAGNFYLHKNGFTVVQHNTDDLSRFYDSHNHLGNIKGPGKQIGKGAKNLTSETARSSVVDHDSVYTLRSHAYQVQFIGGAENPEIIADKLQPGYVNYIIGKDPSKWTQNVKVYQAVLYKNVYPNIDIRYYSENGRLKYDLIVNPGGNVRDIAMRYDGASKLSIKNKELIIKTSVGDVKELYPYTFQFDKLKGKQETACSYELEGNNIVRFKVGNYSKNSTLIIDPTVIFSSFTGSTVDQWGFTATPGPDGSFYSGGIVKGTGFPVSPGAYKTTWSRGGRQGWDIGIFKFSPDGTRRSYATYLGGSSDDYPHSLFCDPQGNLVILGRTYSTDYPGSLQGDGGDCDMVVSKLNANGTALIGSMRIGGRGNDGLNIEDQMESGSHTINSLLRNYGDDSHSEVIIDEAGYIYVAGQSQSDGFPMRGNGFQQTKAGMQDGVILKINPDCNNIIWSSFLGGKNNDAAFVLSLRPSTQEIYVAGGTESDNFPGTTSGVLNASHLGDADGYVAIISNDGSTLIRSTYIGTGSTDLLYGIQFDRQNYPYVLGVTRGDWQPINVAYSNPGSKQFIAKLQPDLTGIVYTTVFGSGSSKPNISPVAFLIDRCENIYVSGWGGWYFPASYERDPYDLAGTVGMPLTPDAMKSVSDGRDFYFIVLERNSSSLLYGSFFGQDGGLGEHVDGGTSRYDAQGAIYQAICANCYGSPRDLPITKSYPTTPGVWAPVNGAGRNGCNLGAVKIAFNFAGVGSGPRAYFRGVFDTVGCVPFSLNFRDTVLVAKSYIWNFGDGSGDFKTPDYNISHTYDSVGTYRVRLIAIDSSTCNIADTAYLNIHVRDDPANLAFEATKLPPCESLTYRFENKSMFPPGKPFNPNSFIWDFGDGNRITPAPLVIEHSFVAAGTYKTRLILIDTAYCNSPDSVVQELRVSPLVDARFETPPFGCAPYTAVFNNTSLAGQQFFWNFGDGTTSTEVNPVHEYPNIATYHVSLVVIDSTTCNIIDSTAMDINVYPRPEADFTAAPMPPVVNRPTIFTNLSSGATEYKWFFGDGEYILKKSSDTVSHQYNSTGTFNVCMIAYNEYGCTDTICKPVEALIDPLLDVPNAFTPGRFGRNSYITVTGFGIAKMNWKIYNRWGKLVFETQDRRAGWDGSYKGELQPMDVYAYVLDVEFYDGKKIRKTGDITLIR
jgi:gliding motility-associated-like protein